jgi:ubiquinone/menaquinone biosynthesis C-methylase UbiE
VLDVLDVGCGTGFLALLLAELGHRVTGADAADEMLALAEEKAAQAGLAVDLQRADAEQLPFDDDSFDLVVERHVIWTLPEPRVALSEWSRVLRPGGHLVLVEGEHGRRSPNPDYVAIANALPLYDGRPSADLASFVAEGGLVDIRVEPLMDAVLWGSSPERERYALHAYVPGS